MNITLRGHDYRYAAEQMMLTLFPEERPGEGDNSLVLSLGRGKTWLTATAKLTYEGKTYTSVRRAGMAELTGGLADDRVCQRVLKLAFYGAGVKALGCEPPWGALTGVRPVKIPARALLNGAAEVEADALLRDTYHVSPIRRRLALDCARESVKVQKSLKEDQISLYIGIPFCPSRCVYCSFISAAVDKCLPLVEPFVEALCRETQALGDRLRSAGVRVSSLYMGGGTPTTLSAQQLERVLDCLTRTVPLAPGPEFTVEAGRPDTITAEKLRVCRAYGVDRVSVNPQSMSDPVLQRMGRPHTAADIRRAYETVRAVGSFAVNMDLIAGLPGDSPEGFASSLEQVISLEPENITVHTLALKKGARLMEHPEELPTPSQVEEMLNGAWALLRDMGYLPYYLYRQKYMSGSFENVGWAKPGFESIYNIVMMEELQTVAALGGGGVTKLVDRTTGKVERSANPKYPQEYLRDIHKICTAKAGFSDLAGPLKGR